MDAIKYGNLFEYLKNRVYPSNFTKQEKAVLRRFAKKFEVDAKSNALFYLDRTKEGTVNRRLVIREDEKAKVFEECHSATYAGHCGRDNTISKIRQRYYWPDCYKETVEMINHCDRCQRNAPDKNTYDVLHPVKVVPRVWYLIGIDLIDAHTRSKKGNKFILTLTDYFTKYVEACPIPDKSADSVARALYSTFCRHGSPAHIISDQGREFVNQVNEALFSLFRIKHRITSAYHPQSNGLDERTNQTLKRTLKKVMKDKEDRWDEYIEGALFAINTNQSTTTRYSPFYLMFGRNPRFPFEAEKSEITPTGSDDIAQLMQDLSNEVVIREHIEETSRMKDALFPIVDSNIQKAQEKQKIQYQKKKGLPVCQFKAGDSVLLRNMLQKTKKGHKLEDQWLGPYEVAEIKADRGVCKLLNPVTKKELKQQSIKNLRPYKQETSTDKPQQPLSAAAKQSQGTPPEAMKLGTKHSKAKFLKGNESGTPERMQAHETQVKGKPDADQTNKMQPDEMQPNRLQSKVEYAAKPHTLLNVSMNSVHLPESKNLPESLPYFKHQQTSGNTSAIADDKLVGNETSALDSEDEHPADGLSPKACEQFDEKILNMNEQDILPHLLNIKNEVHSKFKSNKECWRSEVFSSGCSKEAPGIQKKDLSVNVHFGEFTEDQLQFILNELKKWFPAVGVDFLTTVILPEALIILCMAIFEISYCEAEYYLAHGGRFFAQEAQETFKNRASKRTKSTKRKMPAKKSKPNPTHVNDECVFVKEKKPSANSTSKVREPTYQVEVTKEDENIIMKNHWLTDVQIGKAQKLLKQQFPNVQGLQATTLGLHKQFNVMRSKFVQILHTGAKHWICISNIFCNQMNAIKIYDSMYSGVNIFTKKQIASILYVESVDAIEIMVEPVTQQANGSDCGIFAIAFAASLCYGQDPSKVMFQICNIRSYLWNCLTNGHIDIFPSVPRNYDVQPCKRFLLPIYCKCRLPYFRHEDDMVECSSCHKWYHKKCLEIPEAVFKKKDMTWKCSAECSLRS